MRATVVPARRSERRLRKPQHTFQLRTKPFIIQPFLIAPVIAGETLTSIMMQSRAVSDPIKNPIVGWWKEYYFFYVKLTDIDFWTDQTDSKPGGEIGTRVKMLLKDPSFAPTSYDEGTAAAAKYVNTLSQTYVTDCLNIIVAHYFRDELDADSSFTVDSMPLAMINNTGVLDSAILDSAFTRPDVSVDLDANATITASEVDEALRRWEWMRANGLTDASYDDYLGTFGVAGRGDPDPHRPELLRYTRQWQYPSNTVEPTTGVPSSAVSWGITERADKDRFFREPGFIFGVTCTRPKVYLANQPAAIATYLDRAEDWLPASLWGSDPLAAMKEYSAAAQPFSNQAAGYWLDMKDLYMHGDQFVNFSMSADETCSAVALPSSALNKKFVSSTDIHNLFSDDTTPKAYIREDGICSLTIKSPLIDTSATV